MPDPLAWLDDALADLDRRALRRNLVARTTPQRGDRIEIDGQTLVNFGSNDYLGLAADPRIAAAAKKAVDQYGWGSGASPLITGRSHLHAELERQLAEIEGTEAAVVFSTGYAANVGAITALVGKGDTIYSDELNHASIIDGCRLSGATIHVYRHRDIEHLAQLLERFPADGRGMIVSDSLFSMHGDFAALARLASLAEQNGAMLFVDEAHAIGVYGKSGRGLCEEQEVEQRVTIRVGTLSKALGSIGGFVVGPQKLIDWLANRARPYVFSTAPPAVAAAAALAAIDVVRSEPQRREMLRARALALRQRLRSHGLLGPKCLSHIAPVVLGDPARSVAVSAELRRRGFWVPAIRPPSVPEGQSLLRISVTCLHTEQQIDDLVAALIEVTR